MSSKLEEKLLLIEQTAAVTTDGELIAVLEKIISDEEALPEEERDLDLLNEAIEAILLLQGEDTAELDRHSDALTRDVLSALKAEAKKAKTKKSRSPTGSIGLYLKRAAVFAAIIIVACTASVGLINNVDASLKRAVFIKWYDTHASLMFGGFDSDASETDVFSEEDLAEEDVNPIYSAKSPTELEVGYIPDGFISVTEDVFAGNKFYLYTDPDGRYITINISMSDSTTVSVDTELSEFEELISNGLELYISYNETESTGTVVAGSETVTVSVSGIVPKVELIAVITGIRTTSD